MIKTVILDIKVNTHVRVSEIFSREEIQQLTESSDLRGAWAVASTWAVIGGTFTALIAMWDYLPAWGKIIASMLALAIIAGRQLCLAILMHDASHRSLFKTKALNTFVGEWFCARPIWNDVEKYRQHHLRHHAKTSLEEDPDISLVAGLPTTRRSLLRKAFRDLTGITGFKFYVGRALQDMEILKWTVSNDKTVLDRTGKTWQDHLFALAKNSSGMLITNAALYSVFKAFGKQKFFWLWPLAYTTPFPLFIRIRAMAEHAGMQTSNNALTNTRTTKAGWIARSFVAPIHVNYHMEHHLMATVPYYKLPMMHQKLRDKGLVPKAPSYVDVISALSSKAN